MVLFGKKKEKDCCCGNVTAEKMMKANSAQNEGAAIKILGSGCKKCKRFEGQ